MDCLRNTLCYPVSQNPKKGITYTWILIMILVTALFLAACFMASQLHKGLASDQSAGFSGVWCSLVAIGGLPMPPLTYLSLSSIHIVIIFLASFMWHKNLTLTLGMHHNVCVVSIGGTVIMRKYQSALAIGIFLGIIVVMNFQMLILFAIALSHQNQSDAYSSEVSQGKLRFIWIICCRVNPFYRLF